MSRVIVVGRTGSALQAAAASARAGRSPLLFPAGTADVAPVAVGAPVDPLVWTDAIALPRRAGALALPLDPIDVAGHVGRRRFLADAVVAVSARVGARDVRSLADAHVACLGSRWYARWCAAWLTARFGAAPEALSPALAAVQPPVPAWVLPRADALDRVASAIWDAGGDVGDALAIEGVEIEDGRVVTIVTEAGRESVDSLLFVDAPPDRVDAWHPDAPKMAGELRPSASSIGPTDQPDGVTENITGPVWRVIVVGGMRYAFGEGRVSVARVAPSPADLLRIGERWRWWADRGVVLLGANVGVALPPDVAAAVVAEALRTGAVGAWAVVDQALRRRVVVTPTEPFVA